jgi:hypothetical protein
MRHTTTIIPAFGWAGEWKVWGPPEMLSQEAKNKRSKTKFIVCPPILCPSHEMVPP